MSEHDPDLLDDETLLPVATAIERVTGKRPHPSTCFRWRLRGVRGVKLETYLVGGLRMTSIPAVKRCIVGATAKADGEQPVAHRTNRQRAAAIARAEAALAKEGV